jgi:hypothetical protein
LTCKRGIKLKKDAEVLRRDKEKVVNGPKREYETLNQIDKSKDAMLPEYKETLNKGKRDIKSSQETILKVNENFTNFAPTNIMTVTYNNWGSIQFLPLPHLSSNLHSMCRFQGVNGIQLPFVYSNLRAYLPYPIFPQNSSHHL